MFTKNMYDRFSEWLSNLSLLFLASIVLPTVFSENSLALDNGVIIGLALSFVMLWFSLRFARIAERK